MPRRAERAVLLNRHSDASLLARRAPAVPGAHLGGYDDWYLPNLFELLSLVDSSLQSPAIDPNAFPNTPIDIAFSSSTSYSASMSAWFVTFAPDMGLSHNSSYYANGIGPKTTALAARCVRNSP